MASKNQISIIKNGMKREIDTLNNLPPKIAKKQAKDALVRIGVITETGKVKKQYSGGFMNA